MENPTLVALTGGKSDDLVKPLSVPAPEFEDPTVPQIGLEHDITNGTSTSEGTFFTRGIQTYQVYFDGTLLQDQTIDNAYIDISGPSKFVEYIDVKPMEFIDKIEKLVSADGETITTRIWLVNMDSSKKGSFPYTAKFMNRVTPEGYEWTPKVELFVPDGQGGHKLMATDESATATSKSLHHFPFKYHTLNNLSTYRTDGSTTYGGTPNDQGTGIANPADIVFKFNLSSEDSIGDRLWTQEGWTGDASVNDTRLIDEILITDTLPTYTDINGNPDRVAAFDPVKNPGWTLSEDGKKVTYTVLSEKDVDGNITKSASKVMRDEVELILQFPEISLTSSDDGLESANIINNSEFLYKLVNGTEEEMEILNNRIRPIRPYNNPQDSITFKLVTNKLPGSGYISKTIQNQNIKNVQVDHGGMHLATTLYSISITNPTAYPMKEIVLTDIDYDDHFFIHRFNTGGGGRPMIKEVIGIDSKNVETTIPRANINPWENAYYVYLNEDSIDATLAMSKEVEEGTILAENTQPVDVDYEGIKVVFNEDFILEPGRTVYFSILMKYRDPYHVKDDLSNKLENTARVTANIDMPDTEVDQEINSSSTAEYGLALLNKSISIQKVTWQFVGSQIGAQVRFPLTLNLGNIGKNTLIRGGKVIDLLPVGLTVNKTTAGIGGNFGGLLESKQVVDNYNNTGRQAVIINFRDFRPGELANISGQVSQELVATINENATTQFNPNAALDNRNRVYFTADNFGDVTTETEIVNGKEVIRNYFEINGEKILISSSFEEFGDINLDGIDGGTMIGTYSTFNALLPEAVRGVKSIRVNPSDPWSSGPVYTKYGENFEYKLSAINNANTDLNNLYIYDRLPYIGDHNYVNKDGLYDARNSGFKPTVAGPVTLATSSALSLGDFIVEYRIDNNIPALVNDAMAQNNLWMTADQISTIPDGWALVKAVRIIMKDDVALPAYTSADLFCQ